ncbi:uncharacterized protein LOC128876319 isoform X1 [Hylaeus volcanicus]|uniref:uncharacterized protein LOC128876319 isoform X1 n=1 Tax=Hylaeus volcanicus TaxID=313075 RepID=UPI0023B84606|nr:uncharacterized protein LOC128876319 isoform X1 [Hylaeus volcanicus]
MALTIALPLSGLEPEQFSGLGARLLYDHGFRSLAAYGPISPSNSSESSGICSLVPSIESTTPQQTPASSRPSTPIEVPIKKPEKPSLPIRVYHNERDILNLGANIREPFWQMRIPMMPRYDFRSFMENRSVYFRLGEFGLIEDYPMRTCKDCGFSEPSPYLF